MGHTLKKIVTVYPGHHTILGWGRGKKEQLTWVEVAMRWGCPEGHLGRSELVSGVGEGRAEGPVMEGQGSLYPFPETLWSLQRCSSLRKVWCPLQRGLRKPRAGPSTVGVSSAPWWSPHTQPPTWGPGRPPAPRVPPARSGLSRRPRPADPHLGIWRCPDQAAGAVPPSLPAESTSGLQLSDPGLRLHTC